MASRQQGVPGWPHEVMGRASFLSFAIVKH